MVFIERVPSEMELSAFYSKYAYASDPWISPITIQRYHELLDAFEPYRLLNRIIDVGCGAGHFLQVAKERGWEVYGTEFSPAAIALCKSKGIEMFEGALTEETAAQLEFDVVCSFEVIEHINNPNKDVQHIHRMLRTGGLHYITTPNFNALSRFILKADYNVIGYPEHLSYYTPKSLNFLLNKQGFKTLNCAAEGISISRIQKSRNQSEIKLNSKTAPDEKLRERTERKLFWKLIKKVANWTFRISGTGVTLKGWYIKK